MKTASQKIVSVDTWEVEETPENWTLYKRPTEADEAWMQLRESIAEKGILEPIKVSSDGFIISGHRRFLAAEAEGIEEIPVCIQHDVVMKDLSTQERLTLLADNNRGSRIKTTAEIFMEQSVQIDPEEAIRAAQERKAQLFTKAKCSEIFGEEAA